MFNVFSEELVALKVTTFIVFFNFEILSSNNLKFSANWFLNFLDRHSYWIDKRDHNQLRIKRIKKCLRLLIDINFSDKFLKQVNNLKERKE